MNIKDQINNKSQIRILPDFIANQIAAGEVVQRPESVIKELVENSLDAGAQTIVVVVRGAGKQLIHIIDDGIGMSREDLELAPKRHTTSKIYTSDDLEKISTFGFRGEALASISSISQLEIRTRQKDSEHGWKLISETFKETIIEPINTDFGTQIFVKNLFYNVPARRKFLKSNLTEFRYISDTMLKFALSNNNVRFTFYDEDTLIFDLKPSDLVSRVSDLMGENTAKGLLKVDYKSDYAELNGYVGQPHLAKQSKSGQYLYLNGRWITSKSLNHAVYSAFEHLIEKSANPLFILNLKIDPSIVDVNVHPQKHEVKFEDERHIYGIIHKAISITLQENNLAPELHFNYQLSKSPFEKVKLGPGSDSNMILVNRITGEMIEPNLIKHDDKQFSSNYHNVPDFSNSFDHKISKPILSAYDEIFSNSNNNESFNTLIQAENGFNNLKGFILQVHNKYLIMQTDKGIKILDQHAAHERVLYEKAIKAMNKQLSYGQQLLFPLTIKFIPSEISIIIEIKEELDNLGYVFTIHDEIIELTGVPLDVKSGSEAETFKEIIEEYSENLKLKHTASRDSLAATFSCKAAIKTGQSLNINEIKQLVEDLGKCEFPYSCPHGRPVILEFSLQELDKRFGRT